jgi:hypothetical protein
MRLRIAIVPRFEAALAATRVLCTYFMGMLAGDGYFDIAEASALDFHVILSRYPYNFSTIWNFPIELVRFSSHFWWRELCLTKRPLNVWH